MAEQRTFSADERAREREASEYIIGGQTFHPRRRTLLVERSLNRLGRRVGSVSQQIGVLATKQARLRRRLAQLDDNAEYDPSMPPLTDDESAAVLAELDELEGKRERLQDDMDDAFLEELCVGLRARRPDGSLVEPDKEFLGEALDYEDLVEIVGRVMGTSEPEAAAADDDVGETAAPDAPAGAERPPVPAPAPTVEPGTPGAQEAQASPETSADSSPETSSPPIKPQSGPNGDDAAEIPATEQAPFRAAPSETATSN